MEERKDIKKRLNIYFYYWTIAAFLFFFLLNFYAKTFTTDLNNLGLMISVLSFLFGFLVNMNFSMIQSRFNSLKSDLAGETGRLTILFYLSKKLGNEFHEKMRDLIDEYTICTLRDYSDYSVGRKIFYKIEKEFDKLNIKTNDQNLVAGSFLSTLSDWEQIRERLEYLTSRNSEWSLKLSNYVLGIILIALLFMNRGDFFRNSLFVILSTVIIFIFLIIEDYDHLSISDYEINISNSEQIFDLLLKDRYYPEEVLGKVKLLNGKSYRIGVYDEKAKKEKIYLIKHNERVQLNLSNILRIGKLIGRK